MEEEEDKKVILRWQRSASAQLPSLCVLVSIGVYTLCFISHVYSENPIWIVIVEMNRAHLHQDLAVPVFPVDVLHPQ